MPLDDTAAKVRRNLVVVSAGLIIAQILDLEVDQTSKLFGIIELQSIDLSKFWALVTLALIYIFLRYWFDSDTASQKSHLLSELSIIRLNVLTKYLKYEIKQSFRKNVTPPSVNDFDELKKPELLIRHKNHESLSNINIQLSIERSPGSPWSGWVLPDYQLEWDKKHFSTKNGGSRYQFIVSSNKVKILSALSYMHLCLYSKSSVDFLTPIFLFIISIGICLRKFFSVFLG